MARYSLVPTFDNKYEIIDTKGEHPLLATFSNLHKCQQALAYFNRLEDAVDAFYTDLSNELDIEFHV